MKEVTAKIILLLLMLSAITGCDVSKSNAQSSSRSVDTYTARDQNYDAIVDDCEYFFNRDTGTLTHKGNCKNCREFYKQLFKK